MQLLGIKVTPRSGLAVSASILAGIALLVVLLRASSVRWQEVLGRALSIEPMAFVRLSLLVALSCLLSSAKWQMTDRVVCRGEAEPLPRLAAFGLTTIGMALAQILPIQLSMPATRTLGTLVHGHALRRGAVATLFEQAFDFLVMVLMMAASACTVLLHGGGALWIALASSAALLAVGSVGVLMGAVNRLTARAMKDGEPRGRWCRAIIELRRSGLFQVPLARSLTLISLARYAVLVFMLRQVSSGIHIPIPLWRLAAAVPFGLLAAVVGITPGGLGLSEAVYATLFRLSGLPLTLSTQWAIANRLLSGAAVFVVAGFGVVLLAVSKALERLHAQSLRRAT